MDAEIGMVQPQAKEHQGILAAIRAGRGTEQTLPQPLSLRREHCPADILISVFWPAELGENKFLLLEVTKIMVMLF